MNQHDFDLLFTRIPELAPHADYLRAQLRPCVRARLTDEAPTGTQSRFGGVPTLPPGFEWPEHDDGTYDFIGQIDFAEIVDRPASLPESGVLVLLYAETEDEMLWRDEAFLKAYYFEDPTVLVPTPAPHGQEVPGIRLSLHGELDLPRHAQLYKDLPFDFALLDAEVDDPEAYAGTPSADPLLATDYLLGHPSYYSLGYDPTPGPEWLSLLTLHSHDALDWCWQDGNKLMVFIERDRLAARDFSALKCDAG